MAFFPRAASTPAAAAHRVADTRTLINRHVRSDAKLGFMWCLWVCWRLPLQPHFDNEFKAAAAASQLEDVRNVIRQDIIPDLDLASDPTIVAENAEFKFDPDDPSR